MTLAERIVNVRTLTLARIRATEAFVSTLEHESARAMFRPWLNTLNDVLEALLPHAEAASDPADRESKVEGAEAQLAMALEEVAQLEFAMKPHAPGGDVKLH